MKQSDAVRLILTTRLSDRDIAAAAGVSKTTVGRYRRVADQKQLSWRQLAGVGPSELRRVFNRPASGGKPKAVPDLAQVHAEVSQPTMTLQLWWEEYRAADPHGALSYSHLAAKLNTYRAQLPSVMRQNRVPGERLMVDYSGVRPFYIDPNSGQVVHVELFVGVLAASSLLFAMCTPTQRVPDFIKAHTALLDYIGGVPELLVPDNLTSAVVRVRKKREIQRSYAEWGRHYGVAILPARPYHPKDKAGVEAGVKFAQYRVLARLRHHVFHSIDEINDAIRPMLEEANARPMYRDGISRRARFEAIERDTLRPLPDSPYRYSEWHIIPTVPNDYHVAVEGHFYSVPYHLIGQRVDACVEDTTVLVMHERKCVARHARSTVVGQHTTDGAHQTEAHRSQAMRSPDGMREWAKTAGAFVARFVHEQLNSPIPWQGLPACDEVRGLARKHGTEAVNQAARQALALNSPKVTTMRRLLASAAHRPSDSASRRPRNARGARAIMGGESC